MIDMRTGWIERQRGNKPMYEKTAEVEIAVPTMMHSGTHILRFCILKGHYKMEPDAPHYFNGDSGRVAHYFHLNHDQFPVEYEWMMQSIPVYTSLRHPHRMWQSYIARSERDHLNYRHEKFILQWRRLIDLVAPNNPHYVHVDDPEGRDKQVAAMGESLGLDLSFDWKVSAKSGSVHGNEYADVRADKMVPQEFVDFYEDTRCRA